MSKLLNSINAKYLDRIDVVVKYALDLDSKKIKIIEITEDYYLEVGEQIPPQHLYLLTEWLLADTLKCKDVDKVTNTEYPILSKYQIKRRNKKQVVVMCDTLDHLNQTRGRQSKRITQNKQEHERI